mmetsp:Transcript_6228/g.9021  ORF Transcript_6228/g.9021 Transcript_6228/m.9021 type:complete len:241 (+) Transcript_6228:165-887(+)
MITPFLYPVQGGCYLLTHPKLWKRIFCVVLLGLFVTVSILALLLTVALAPQALALGGMPWSWVLAFVAVLIEATVAAVIALKCVTSRCQKTLFVEIMKEEGRWTDEMIEPSMMKDLNPCKWGTFVVIITAPLNFIPVVGTVVFAIINSPWKSQDYMEMYMDALQMDEKSQKEEIFGKSFCINDHVKFGTVCFLLEVVPVLGPSLFAFTNACGAALWACQMEKNGGPKSLRSSDSKSNQLL